MLPSHARSQQAETVRAEEEGHELDDLAVRVFQAKADRIRLLMAIRKFDTSRVRDRLAKLIVGCPAGMRFDPSDIQRHVAISLGYYLAVGGIFTGDVWLPDPWDFPDLRAMIERDARIRYTTSVDPGERQLMEIDLALQTDGFMGSRDKPLARARAEIVSYISGFTGMAPATIGKSFLGFRDPKTGATYPGLVDRSVLRRCDPEIEQEIAEGRYGGRRVRPGRPAALYAYVWPEDRHPDV